VLGRGARAARAATFVAGLGAFAFLLASAHVPCGFARLFHTPCPGCGSTRAMLALFEGDVHGMLRFNPLAPFMTLIVAVVAAQAVVSLLRTGTFREVGTGAMATALSRGALVIAILEFVVWIARFQGFLGGPVPV
jgi:hypothetical protein